MPDIVALGEPMVEFNQARSADPSAYLQGFGGDTSNMAIAAARLGARAGYVTRLGNDAFHFHQPGSLEAGFMMARLAAIAAILGAPAGLDAEQPAELDLVGIESPAVDGLRLEQEIVERRIVKCQRLFFRPILADVAIYRRRRIHLAGARCNRHIPSVGAPGRKPADRCDLARSPAASQCRSCLERCS